MNKLLNVLIQMLPLIYLFIMINFMIWSNVDLFLDVILSPKNREKLIKHCAELYEEEKNE